jgi:hypothetical protein
MLIRQPLSLIGLTVILISGCSPASNKAIESLQAKILEDIVTKGGSSLKSVVCPADQPKAETLICTGILESGSGFDIPVKSAAAADQSWEVVSIKGLLNMSQLQTAIQSGLTTELGNATIDCGTPTPYKVTKPGEQFECQVTGTKSSDPKDPKTADKDSKAADSTTQDKAAKATDAKASDPKAKSTKPEKVVVTIASSGDISWQRVLPAGKENAANAKGGSEASKDAAIDKPSASGASDKADPKSIPDSKATSSDAAATPPASSPEAALDNAKLDDLQ